MFVQQFATLDAARDYNLQALSTAFDKNQDGTVDRATECLHGYEYVLPLPDAVARRADVPFKWVLLNWNPVGHVPPGVYDVAHFDVHFYMEPIAKVFALQSGPCGPELMRCDQFEIGRQPVPGRHRGLARCPSDLSRIGGRVTPWRSSSAIWLTTYVTSGAPRPSRRAPRMPTGHWP